MPRTTCLSDRRSLTPRFAPLKWKFFPIEPCTAAGIGGRGRSAKRLTTTTEKRAIQKADVLIEALHWIREFRGKVTVIKLGGSVMEDTRALKHLLLDIVFMESVGVRPVVVHGGGAAISRAMAAAGLEPRFVQGRRFTDAPTRDIVEQVLAYETNEQICKGIEDLGGRSAPLNFRTTNVLFGQRLELA